VEDDCIRCRWKSPKNTLPTLADMEKEAIVGYYVMVDNVMHMSSQKASGFVDELSVLEPWYVLIDTISKSRTTR